MQWADDGIVLSARKHGETAAIVQLLTRDHGRHAGLVRGGVGRRMRGVLQPGNEVRAEWRARLPEHLGHYTVELTRARAAALMDDPVRLAGLAAACAVAELTLPEREPHVASHGATRALLDALEEGAEIWPYVYVRWELGLLAELGFGLDLASCAVTGSSKNLTFVSPRSGRAVSDEGAGQYRDRLLKLPGFLLGNGAGGDEFNDPKAEIEAGLELTGHFLEHSALRPHDQTLPAARTRLLERFARSTTRSGVNVGK
ncbi:MAG: DNA repair protein RecO [Alphaproteobacteria bacterium]|mgnify:CR=1 FL=1|jgi:DNA repair protein RecO (recombination protein O)|nr:DNA repair protein RecO [Rhodospirillaceae bacterium]MDP6407138.1 DNA repair protein RecO [Alphaproteobacteria bacterium]|tara:strand:- start:114 stop:884 length:771 start_codon:yes stop_codon:yes gene_type:complete